MVRVEYAPTGDNVMVVVSAVTVYVEHGLDVLRLSGPFEGRKSRQGPPLRTTSEQIKHRVLYRAIYIYIYFLRILDAEIERC